MKPADVYPVMSAAEENAQRLSTEFTHAARKALRRGHYEEMGLIAGMCGLGLAMAATGPGSGFSNIMAVCAPLALAAGFGISYIRERKAAIALKNKFNEAAPTLDAAMKEALAPLSQAMDGINELTWKEDGIVATKNFIKSPLLLLGGIAATALVRSPVILPFLLAIAAKSLSRNQLYEIEFSGHKATGNILTQHMARVIGQSISERVNIPAETGQPKPDNGPGPS